MPTVDANGWIAAFDPSDAFHDPSATFIRRLSDRTIEIHGPEIVVVEVACSVARRLRDPTAGMRAARSIRSHPLVRFYPDGEQLLNETLRIGSEQFLRAADAFYAATARMTSTVLVSWDNQLIERAGAITPTDWLVANP